MSTADQSMGGGGGGGGGDNAGVKISSEIVVAAIIFFFMVVVLAFFFYLYAKRRLRSALRTRSRSRFDFAAADLGPLPVPGRGLEAAMLRSLPVTVYRAADFKQGIECAVCLSQLTDGEVARLLPKCGHGFHLDCIDMWFCSHSTCPLCRRPVGINPNAEPVSGLPTVHAQMNAGDSVTTATVENRDGSLESSSSSSGALVIEIPRRVAEAFPPTSRLTTEEATSPVPARFRSLMRLWSQGRRAAGASHSLSEGGDTEATREGSSGKH
ncbi:E3 ubiquitin-protein ligase EL5-like [Musa acuminata AAA Group]|uniref:E3 ubiquitin-protein ligase EL5-like n=1 Tax=Musa acuminata AAA Group TaxID=214697 RepID=UPI0031DCBDFD